jgi:DNA-binding PadR family transcriptional regulator
MGEKIPNLSGKEFVILEMLLEAGEMFGLEMVDASNGELKKGTIYVTLQRMSEKGLVESRAEPRAEPEIGIARRKYQATNLGQTIFKSQELARKYFQMNAGY